MNRHVMIPKGEYLLKINHVILIKNKYGKFVCVMPLLLNVQS